jgi:23S rRNA pseudouridine1911/1915/1917 synthase
MYRAMGLFPKDRDLTRPPREVELVVDASNLRMRADAVEIRLDHFLVRHLKWRSRSSIQGLIRDGHLLVDAVTPDHPGGTGTLVVERRPARRLRHGSRVVIVIPEELRLPEPSGNSEDLVVLYEDAGILAVDKPPLLAVHPSGRHLSDTLIQRVHARYGGGQELERGGAPRLCHRLDRETSGIVLIGKDPDSHHDVMRQFERRRVDKEYLALVHGAPTGARGTIDLPIGPARASRVGLKMAVAVDGQPSVTEWSLVERRPHCSLVSCRPVTGRQHQIRVHLEAIGLPVVGDKLYGADEELFQKGVDGTLSDADLRRLGLPRHALHNHRVAFTSPATGERVEIASPLPGDMRGYLERE